MLRTCESGDLCEVVCSFNTWEIRATKIVIKWQSIVTTMIGFSKEMNFKLILIHETSIHVKGA